MESILNSLVLFPLSVIQLEIRISYVLKLKKVIKRMLQGPLGYCRNALKYYLDIQECGVLRK
jgi:hypothetical protein